VNWFLLLNFSKVKATLLDRQFDLNDGHNSLLRFGPSPRRQPGIVISVPSLLLHPLDLSLELAVFRLQDAQLLFLLFGPCDLQNQFLAFLFIQFLVVLFFNNLKRLIILGALFCSIFELLFAELDDVFGRRQGLQKWDCWGNLRNILMLKHWISNSLFKRLYN